jgi:hypothetical protein
MGSCAESPVKVTDLILNMIDKAARQVRLAGQLPAAALTAGSSIYNSIAPQQGHSCEAARPEHSQECAVQKKWAQQQMHSGDSL